MKFFYAIAILIQLLLAFLSGNKNKTSYMLNLWKGLFDYGIVTAKSKPTSESTLLSRESKLETGNDEYSFLLER